MDDKESRELLIAAGIPEEDIDPCALAVASAVGDAVIEAATKRLVQNVIADYLSDNAAKIRRVIRDA